MNNEPEEIKLDEIWYKRAWEAIAHLYDIRPSDAMAFLESYTHTKPKDIALERVNNMNEGG